MMKISRVQSGLAVDNRYRNAFVHGSCCCRDNLCLAAAILGRARRGWGGKRKLGGTDPGGGNAEGVIVENPGAPTGNRYNKSTWIPSVAIVDSRLAGSVVRDPQWQHWESRCSCCSG